MDNQQQNSQHGTLDSMAENLKDGVASAPDPVFADDAKKAGSSASNRAGKAAGNVIDLASATSKAAEAGAKSIGKAALAAKSKAAAGAREIVSEASGEAASLSTAIGDAATSGIALVKSNVVSNPLKSIALAAAFGYLAAIVLRASD